MSAIPPQQQIFMKILHTADWHLGNTFHGYSRTDEHAHFLEWLLDSVRRLRPDALILSGDIFDTPNPPAAAERQFYDFLTAATNAVSHLQIVVTAGNHDSGGRIEAPAELLRRSNVYVRGLVRRNESTGELDFDHYILPLSEQGSDEARVVCYAIPYLRAADYPTGLSPTEGLTWFLENLRRCHRKSDFRGLPVVVAAHFYAAGADVCDNEHSERLVVGGQECIDATSIGTDAAYVALGHLHKAQRIAAAKVDMRYAGSALPMSFAEKNYHHGAWWVEVSDSGETAVSRLDYTPQRSLLSIPANGAIDAAAVIDAIAALPRREKGDEGQTWPYLEIRVLENGPLPSLMHEVTQALADRAIHFCRMVREMPQRQSEATTTPPDTLSSLSPIDLAQSVYQQIYAADMPEPLSLRFKQAAEAATTSETAEATPQ